MPKNWFEYLDKDTLELAIALTGKAESLRHQGHTIYPPQDKIFRALDETPVEKLKVVLVGQDPYINPGQAEGLCFSVTNGTPAPPSLQNIFKELVSDIGCQYPTTTSLLPWARQGVLLLNTTLTVERGQSNSHANWGWDKFTHQIFKVAASLEKPVVFIAWGRSARDALAGLPVQDPKQNKILITSPHPSPFSADKGFFGSKPFSKANRMLAMMGVSPVDWRLP